MSEKGFWRTHLQSFPREKEAGEKNGPKKGYE